MGVLEVVRAGEAEAPALGAVGKGELALARDHPAQVRVALG